MKNINFKVLILFIVIVSCKEDSPLITEGTFTLSGKITDSENNDPISGVKIQMDEFEDSTNIEGYFELKNLSQKEYTLFLTHPDYEEYSSKLVLTRDSAVNISLSIIYNDYFPLENYDKEYGYSYIQSHGSPRTSYIKKNGISRWVTDEIITGNASTIYTILETRIDSVERYESLGGTFYYQDTIRQYFEIIENSNHILSSAKFPNNVTVSRFIRSDELENQYFSSSNGFVQLNKSVGITHLTIGTSQGEDIETTNYILIK